MARVPKREPDQTQRRRRAPGKTLEARENQLISLAVDLAEKQLSEGTASSMVITHYLKLGTTRERLEKERLVEENKLLRAKTESLKSMGRMEELMDEAIKAMRQYQGLGNRTEDDDDIEDS